MNLQKALRKWLNTHFSINQLYVSGGEIRQLSESDFTPVVRVGRDLCRYSCLDFSHVPQSKRNQALKHGLSLKSPWEDFDYSVSWIGGWAQVWYWNNQDVLPLVAPFGRHALRKPLILPAFVFSSTLADGFYLFDSDGGYEIQYWDQGVLKSSHWFSSEPEKAQVLRFIRGQGKSLQNVSITQHVLQLSGSPWPDLKPPFWEFWFDYRKQGLAFIFLASCCLMTLQLNAIVHWVKESTNIQLQTEELRKGATELLNARNIARESLYEAEELIRLLDVPKSLASQDMFVKHLPAGLNIKLLKWERNSEIVDVLIEGEIGDSFTVVRSLEAGGMQNVVIEQIKESQFRLRFELSVVSSEGSRA
ncbi:MAG: hypothetical protein K6L73_04265 [Cellvibrionaceae bacterium]